MTNIEAMNQCVWGNKITLATTSHLDRESRYTHTGAPRTFWHRLEDQSGG